MTYNVKMDTNNGHIEFEGKADLNEQFNSTQGPVFNLSRDKMSELFDKK